MIDTDDLSPERKGLRRSGLDMNEALLRSEVGFWREMIESSEGMQTPECIERMHQARALAESKLRLLLELHQEATRAEDDYPSNVYQLDRARRKPD